MHSQLISCPLNHSRAQFRLAHTLISISLSRSFIIHTPWQAALLVIKNVSFDLHFFSFYNARSALSLVSLQKSWSHSVQIGVMIKALRKRFSASAQQNEVIKKQDWFFFIFEFIFLCWDEIGLILLVEREKCIKNGFNEQPCGSLLQIVMFLRSGRSIWWLIFETRIQVRKGGLGIAV